MDISYAQTKYDYDESGNCIYRGQHRDPNIDDDDGFWIITKYGYDANGNCNSQLMRTGSWTDREDGW